MRFKPKSDWICSECKDPDRRHRAKGLCVECYGKEYRKERIKSPEPKLNFLCSECKDLTRKHRARGLCNKCYAKYYYRNKQEIKRNLRSKPDWICLKCRNPNRKHSAKGLCQHCYDERKYKEKYGERKNFKHGPDWKCPNCGSKKYCANNLCEKCYSRRRYLNGDPKEHKEMRATWYQKNKKHHKSIIKDYKRNRYQIDIEFKIRSTITGSLSFQLKRQNNSKNGQSYRKYVPFTIQKLKKHLESQFNENTNWNNYGTYWWIDHIIPQSLYDFTSLKEIKKCWSLKNLRPLEKSENIRKNNKLDWKLIEEYNLLDIFPVKSRLLF